ncbi:MAG: ice-binding family protein [Bacteroidota bacterium]
MNNVNLRHRSSADHVARAVGILIFFTAMIILAGCDSNTPTALNNQNDASRSGSLLKASEISILGTASTFAVLGATTVTNDGASVVNGDLGVSPGTAITGFQPSPINLISGPGTVTAGLGIVNGTIYAGGPVAAQAHNDAVIAYNYLIAQTPNTVYSGVTQLDGMTFTPGVYSFSPSANLQVNGTIYLDFQGNNDALFIFQMGSTLVTMTGSKVVALNSSNQTCTGSNVYWTIGSSATIDGAEFIGTVIATTTITMTSGASVDGRILALNGAVTMIEDTISVCGSSNGGPLPPQPVCDDFITGGGWIKADGQKNDKDTKATFGVSGGIKHNEFWGQLSYDDHSANGVKVKSTSVTGYFVIDAVTRRIEGLATVNGNGSYSYSVTVVDNGEPGRSDSFSIQLSNGYQLSGMLLGGNIQLHKDCKDEKKQNH